MPTNKPNDDLGQPGEIRQYEHHEHSAPVRGDERNPSKSDATPIYVSGDSILQTPEEAAHDSSVDSTKDATMAASNDDLHETVFDVDRGSDRAGTAERKEDSME